MSLGFSVGLDVSWYASNHAFGASKELTGFIAAGITLGVFASRENCNIIDSRGHCQVSSDFVVIALMVFFCRFKMQFYSCDVGVHLVLCCILFVFSVYVQGVNMLIHCV